MTEYIVPMGTPEFYAGTVPVVDPTRFTWAGAYPYIDTADEDGSYGEVSTVGLFQVYDRYVGSTLPAYIAPAGITSARVDFQIHIAAPAGQYYGGMWWMQCLDVAAPWNFSGYGSPNTPVVGWNTVTDTVVFDPTSGPEYDLPAMLAALATGSMRFSVVQGQLNVVFRVSLLRLTLISSAPTFLWNAQRTGGGGRSAGRGRGDTTQQGSCRNRGGIH